MSRYRLTPLARADLDTIWTYTEKTWDAQQAEDYVRSIRDAIESVAANPRQGRSCDDVRPGYRRYLVGSHMIFYRTAEHGIEITRILHVRMDVERHL